MVSELYVRLLERAMLGVSTLKHVCVGSRRREYKSVLVFFFFQAEDGIRDRDVTEFRRVLFRSPYLSFLINENILGKCFRSSSSSINPRISPLTIEYEYPQLSLLIITIVRKPTK